jgi:hypothetical protein
VAGEVVEVVEVVAEVVAPVPRRRTIPGFRRATIRGPPRVVRFRRRRSSSGRVDAGLARLTRPVAAADVVAVAVDGAVLAEVGRS